MKVIVGILLALLIVGTASADTVRTYAGNSTSGPETGGDQQVNQGAAINPCRCSLSGFVLMDALGNAIAWSFTDGISTLTNFNSSGRIASFDGFPQGDLPPFFTWSVFLTGDGQTFLSEYYGSAHEATDSTSDGLYVQGNRGSWTEVLSTPEPGTFLLVGLGLTLCCFLRRETRKIKKAHAA